MARHFSFVFLLIALALASGAYAADSSSPSPPTTSNTTGKSPPVSPSGLNSTNGQDYSDYEVPMDLAPDGVEIVEDYVPISQNEGKEADDELAQPEDESNKKTNKPENSASSLFSSSYYSSSFVVFLVATGLFLF